MIVETHFQVDFKYITTCFRLTFVVNIRRFFLQMNYSSGQWTRIKKYRRMEEQQQQQQWDWAAASAATKNRTLRGDPRPRRTNGKKYPVFSAEEEVTSCPQWFFSITKCIATFMLAFIWAPLSGKKIKKLVNVFCLFLCDALNHYCSCVLEFSYAGKRFERIGGKRGLLLQQKKGGV